MLAEEALRADSAYALEPVPERQESAKVDSEESGCRFLGPASRVPPLGRGQEAEDAAHVRPGGEQEPPLSGGVAVKHERLADQEGLAARGECP